MPRVCRSPLSDNMRKTDTKLNPISWVSTVYFAMGLPMVMLSDVSLLLFKDMGIPDKEITFWASLLILPWSLKPFFSPVMELFGSKRQYVFISEIISALMLGLIAASLGLEESFPLLLLLMAVMALSGSVHDIAGDGIYMEALTPTLQSKFVGWQGAFYNIAKVLAKGGLVYLVGYLTTSIGIVRSWQSMVLVVGGLMLLLGLWHMAVLPHSEAPVTDEKRSLRATLQGVWEIFVSFFEKKHIWFYLLFIFLYRFTEGLAIKVAPLFLKAGTELGGLGLTNKDFGLIYGTLGTIAFIGGSILAGYYIGHYGLRKVLFTLALIFNLPFIIFFLLAFFHPTNLVWPAVGIVVEQFGYGFGFVGLTLFMMQQVAPGPHRMAHYAIANSLMNLSYMIPGLVSGTISDAVGYSSFFLIAVLVSIPGLICAKIVPFSYDGDGNKLTK